MRTLLVALVVATPLASAQLQEVPLPNDWTAPSNLAFDAHGDLWLTLDGPWGIGRWDREANATEFYPLPTPKRDVHDTMGALRFAADGSIWTASQTHIHHLAEGKVTSYPLPTWGYLPADVRLEEGGRVWLAIVDKNLLVEFDPESESMQEHKVPDERGGPVEFGTLHDGRTFVTITYAGKLAQFETRGAETTFTNAKLDGPVGLAPDGSGFWIAEMGRSAISRVMLANGTNVSSHTRYPTSSSQFYSVSGPSGILTHPDGSIWFAQHFADRVARLDPKNGTLHEYSVPSGPGTDTQRVALGPDGKVWFAEYSSDKIGHVSQGKSPVVIHTNFTAILHAGESTMIEAHTLRPIEAAAADANITLTPRVVKRDGESTAWNITVETKRELAPGTYKILLSVPDLEDPNLRTGRYLDLVVLSARSQTSMPVLLAVAALAAGFLLRRRTS